MSLLIDEPIWPAHQTVWSHLVSDVSYDELHAFAEAQGLPRRAFDHDHYDVPARRYDDLVAAGAQPVGGKELAIRLEASGLRVPQWRKRAVPPDGGAPLARRGLPSADDQDRSGGGA